MTRRGRGLGGLLRSVTPKGAVRSLVSDRRVSVEEQVATLARLGLPPEGELTLAQITAADVDLMETHPYSHVLRRLGQAPDGGVRPHPRVDVEVLETEPVEVPAPQVGRRGVDGLVPVTTTRGRVRLTARVLADRAEPLRDLFATWAD